MSDLPGVNDHGVRHNNDTPPHFDASNHHVACSFEGEAVQQLRDQLNANPNGPLRILRSGVVHYAAQVGEGEPIHDSHPSA